MKKTPWLFAGLLLLAPLGAEELLPPVPEGLDGPPPAADEQIPSLQDFDKFLPGNEPTQTDLEPGPAKPEAALQAIEKALPTPTPSPVKAQAAPTATALPAKPAAAAPAVAAPAAAVPAASPAAAAPAGNPATTALTDYFPAQAGMKWTYQYLKSAAAKRMRSVECTQAEAFPNGTLRASFQVTEESAVPETYSLLEGAVQKTSQGGAALEGEYAFKLPKKGLPASWTSGARTFSASFGKAQVYQKLYPDCVVVKQKAAGSTTFAYYAKGIGLVALEIYGAGMKLDQTKSYALTSGPTQ